MAVQDTPQELSGEHIRESASGTMRADGDIHTRVHDLTVLALRSRRFDRHEIREVVRAITEGITIGAGQSRADARQSLSAFGVAEPCTRSTESSSVSMPSGSRRTDSSFASV